MLTPDRPSLKALYYPYSFCTNETALKRLLLIFDTVCFIYPQSSGFAFADKNNSIGNYSLIVYQSYKQKQVFTGENFIDGNKMVKPDFDTGWIYLPILNSKGWLSQLTQNQ